jgi:pimeloyl-ACP methyl ester carboxylesterase
MGRAVRIAIVAVIVLVAVLIVNAVVLDSQTRSAEVNAPGGKLIEVNGVTLQYTDQAATKAGREGEPIVLLHCYTCSGRWWDAMTPLLSDHHRVVTFDLLGHGGSEKPSSGYEIGSQSAAVAAAMNKLGIRQATVVGHSMGGLVATSLAEQSSDLVDRVVLIATPAEPGDAALPFLARVSRAPVIGEAIWRVKLPSMVKSSYGDAFAPGADVSDMFENPDQVVDDLGDMTYKSYKESNTAANDFLDAGSVPSRLRSTGVPVLAIDGTEDQILDSEKFLGDMQTVPGARIVSIEGAGHSPNVEEPQETADAVLPFADAGGAVEPLPTRKPTAKGEQPKAKGPQAGRARPKGPNAKGKRAARAGGKGGSG